MPTQGKRGMDSLKQNMSNLLEKFVETPWHRLLLQNANFVKFFTIFH